MSPRVRRALLRFLPGALLPVLVCLSGGAMALDPDEEDYALKLLGKSIFFDTGMSIPNNKQGCVSCHVPAVGWVLHDPNSQVVADGAAHGASGTIKPPANAYAVFDPIFQPAAGLAVPYVGGNFWDARAEGCGKDGLPECQFGQGNVAETITPASVGLLNDDPYVDYLGPTADQAFNPFINPVEQNSRIKKVCQRVKTAKYKKLYDDAFGERIDCRNKEAPAPNSGLSYLEQSYRRVALALAAWQASDEVNPFNSRREQCLQNSPGNMQGCDKLTALEKQGHALFYGLPPGFGGTGAGCALCHSNAGPNGNTVRNTYSDSSFHVLPLPYRADIGVAKGAVVGLSGHLGDADATVPDGAFQTPVLVNISRGESVRPYMHNGYLETLEQVVHWYNTGRFFCDVNANAPGCKKRCEDEVGDNASVEEAIANNCWPEPEFDNWDEATLNPVQPGAVPPGIVGNLGLDADQEKALVAYLRALEDTTTPTAP